MAESDELRDEGEDEDDFVGVAGLARSPVFLLREFFESITPIADRLTRRTPEQQQEFLVLLLPYLVAYCREMELPQPYETSLFIVDLIRNCAGSLTACKWLI
jgi:hypothetical protein